MKRRGGRGSGSGTMKPEEFASGERDDSSVPVEKHMIPARPKPFSSAFLQPEQFIAELKVTSGADVRPELAFLASRRRDEDEDAAAQCGGGGVDLECFYEPANSVATLELSYEGKPAPLRTRPPLKAPPAAAATTTESESSPVLQKSGSSGRSFKGAASFGKQLVRSLSRGSRESEPETKPTGRFHRLLHWGASKGSSNPIEKQQGQGDEEEGGSPRSSASSVSTTYSEVSSKSQSYKQSAHKKAHKSEVVRSKLWLLRVQGGHKDSLEDDGIYAALRQGAMHTTTTDRAEENDSLGVLESKSSISKLVAKHKRNSTWDAGNNDHIFSPRQPRLRTRDAHVLLAPPKRLTTEPPDPQPPSRLEQASRLPSPPSQNRTSQDPTPPSQDPTPPSPPGPPAKSTTVSPIWAQLPTPPMSPGAKSRTSPTMLPLPVEPPATSPANSYPAGNSPGMQKSPGARSQQRLHSVEQFSLDGSDSAMAVPVEARATNSPRPNPGNPAGSPGMQKSPGSNAPAGTRSQRPEQFSLDGSVARSQADLASQVQARSQADAVSQSASQLQARSDSAMAVARIGGGSAGAALQPLPREPTVSAVSFEQIVAGRGRSPPTDNTLMKFFFKCREIDRLNHFLVTQKKRFLDPSFSNSEKCFHMIMSESGAGISSMVSTICTAWLLENTMASGTARLWHPIPVLNMSHEDMWNHRDAAWLFHVCGIDANAVLFRDEITPTNEAVISGRVKRAVIGQDILVTKADEVSSSCTIVSEKFRQEAPKLLQARYMMTLLLAGILVDTKNLASGSARDQQQATMLLVGAGSLGRNGFYKHLVGIRDEDYVTTFIKEIYGDNNALIGEKAVQVASETKVAAGLQNDERPQQPVAAAATKNIASSGPILPSGHKAATTETKSKSMDDIKSSSKKQSARSPSNSIISLALRRLRNRPTSH